MRSSMHWLSLSKTKAPVRYCAECDEDWLLWDKPCKHEAAVSGGKGFDTRVDDPLSEKPGNRWLNN